MDKRVLRERMRKKQQQIRRRQMMKKGAYIVAIILVFVFVIRGIIPVSYTHLTLPTILLV